MLKIAPHLIRIRIAYFTNYDLNSPHLPLVLVAAGRISIVLAITSRQGIAGYSKLKFAYLTYLVRIFKKGSLKAIKLPNTLSKI